MSQPWGIGIPDTFIAPCVVCGSPSCYAHADVIRTNPTIEDYRVEMHRLLGEMAYLKRIAETASALLQYDKAIISLSEGSDEGAYGQAQQLFEGAFDDLEMAVSEYEHCKNPTDE